MLVNIITHTGQVQPLNTLMGLARGKTPLAIHGIDIGRNASAAVSFQDTPRHERIALVEFSPECSHSFKEDVYQHLSAHGVRGIYTKI